MIYQFGPYELDMATVELRAGGRICDVKPQVFALLALLVENHDRLVSKTEIINKVWDGRIVSDAAVASRVKSARQALGDDGQTQRFIRTIHRRGFRFVADVKACRGAAAVSGADAGDAVPVNADTASAVQHPTRPSRLRWLFVTARGRLLRVHFQTAFMRYTDDLVGETGQARRFAASCRRSRSWDFDDRDAIKRDP